MRLAEMPVLVLGRLSRKKRRPISLVSFNIHVTIVLELVKVKSS